MRRTTILNAKEIKRTPLKEAESDFHKHCKLKNLTEQTLRYYKEDLSYFRSKVSVKYADEITQEIFEAFLLQELDAGKKVTSLNSRIRGLRVFFNFCVEREYMKPIDVYKRQPKKFANSIARSTGGNAAPVSYEELALLEMCIIFAKSICVRRRSSRSSLSISPNCGITLPPQQ